MPPIIEVTGLHVRFPRRTRPALIDVDLSVDRGERVLLIGRSGSGKSTLLQVLAGIVPESIDAELSGTVRVAGRDPTGASVAQRSAAVAWMGQDPAAQVCLPRVDDEVALPLENRAVPAAEIGPRVGEALAMTGTTHLRSRPTAHLSGGELQRVALAAALATEPSVLLLDEPTSSLDPSAARDVARVLAGLGGRCTQVAIHHQMAEFERLPPRLVVLGPAGAVLAAGPTVDVLDRHAGAIAAAGCWLPLVPLLRLAVGVPIDRFPTGARAADVLTDPAVNGALRRLAAGTPATRQARRQPAALTARAVSYARDDREIVHDVSLTLRPGEITTVVGPNGGGKSTLFAGLAGLLPAAAGSVVGGPAGLVFQRPELQFLERTVAADIAAGLDLPGKVRRRLRTAPATRPLRENDGVPPPVWRALLRFGLTDVAYADPYRLSGGQQRRLSIAAMTVLGQPVLLVDEPTFALDRIQSESVAAALQDVASGGVAIAIITHDIALAARLSDQLAVLVDGRLVACGPPDVVLRDPGVVREAGLRLPDVLRWAVRHGIPAAPLLRGLSDALVRGQHAAGAMS